MENAVLGIHHITVLAGSPQDNYNFYSGLLGLRLVKKTVNFDAPDVYHLYYGDEQGNPGTIMTFFPFPDARRGKRGAGEISAVAFSIPSGSLNFWMDRLAEKAVDFSGPFKRFDEEYISLLDPDGMLVELVPDKSADGLPGWSDGSIPVEHSVRKFFGVTITQNDVNLTAGLLHGQMGLNPSDSTDHLKRYVAGTAEAEVKIDLIERPDLGGAKAGAGSVHHIAWRTANDEEQINWQSKIDEAGLYPTQVMDRNYFHSIYFHEPGGVLFEIATDPPGFLIDEDIDSLGESLKLPEWYESRRKQIEAVLPVIETGKADVGAG